MLSDDKCEVFKNTENTGMRLGYNKKVNAHNALRYSADGVQSINDSTDSQLPETTFIIGLPRTITFECMTKVVSGGKVIGS